MSTEIRMPQMGESIAEATVTRWMKKPGDTVKRDEILFEISTDKVDTEVPAPADGVLEEIVVEEGATVEVNAVVARLGDGSGASGGGSDQASGEQASKEKSSKQEQSSAEEKPSSEEKQAESAPEPEAAPVATEAPARSSGAASGSSASSSQSTKSDGSKVRSSPLVRKIAREHGVADLSSVPGTGVQGRVTKQDILNFVDNGGASAAPAPAAAPAQAPAPAHGGVPAHHQALPVLNLPREGTRVESLTSMRKKIAEHMIDSKRTSAHVHSVFEADMTNIVSIRNREKKTFEERHGVKLTFMSFFTKAVCDAIKDFPWVNASLDGDDILIHQHVNMGLAVALEGGLIVPVIRNADELNLVGLQRRTTDLANRARSKALMPEEVTSGTFTITNPGQFGGLFGIPIINQPQVAILGLGGIQKRPVVTDDGAIAVRDMVYMCLGYDHRLVDGAYADQFMARVKTNLESWQASSL